MAQITYTDKDKNGTGVVTQWRDVDANEIKDVVNTNETAQSAHEARVDNPHAVSKAQVGLSNVDNTSDATKNSAVVTLTNKTLTSPVINSPTGIVKEDVGLGNVDNTSDVNKPVSTAQAAADALKMDKNITANRQAASYALVLADAGKLVEMNVAGANNLTVPLNSSVAFPIGTQILISQYGAGQTTVVAIGGVTIRSKSGNLKLSGQYSGATLVKIAADEWYLFGDLTA